MVTDQQTLFGFSEEIVEFNCLREDPKEKGEYIFFGTEIKPACDFAIALEQVKTQIKMDGWDCQVWVCGYWKGNSCYNGGKYESIEWKHVN